MNESTCTVIGPACSRILSELASSIGSEGTFPIEFTIVMIEGAAVVLVTIGNEIDNYGTASGGIT